MFFIGCTVVYRKPRPKRRCTMHTGTAQPHGRPHSHPPAGHRHHVLQVLPGLAAFSHRVHQLAQQLFHLHGERNRGHTRPTGLTPLVHALANVVHQRDRHLASGVLAGVDDFVARRAALGLPAQCAVGVFSPMLLWLNKGRIDDEGSWRGHVCDSSDSVCNKTRKLLDWLRARSR